MKKKFATGMKMNENKMYVIDYMYIQINFIGLNTYKRGCAAIPGNNRNEAEKELERRLAFFGLQLDQVIEVKRLKKNECTT